MVRWPAVLLMLMALAVSATVARSIPSYAGRYLSYADHCGHCNEEDNEQGKVHMRCAPYNPARPFVSQNCSGNVTLVEDLDATWWYSRIMDQRSGNRWLQNFMLFNISDDPLDRAYHRVTDSCTIFSRIFQSPREPSYACVVKKGTYPFKEYSHMGILKDSNMATFPYGFYRLREMYGKGNRTLLCYWAEVHVVPIPGIR